MDRNQKLLATPTPGFAMVASGFGREGLARLAAFVVVATIHAAGMWLLWQYAPAREAMRDVATLMVSFVRPEEPPRTDPPKPSEPPRPKPMHSNPAPHPAEPPPILALPEDAPAPAVTVTPPREPAPPAIEAPPAPVLPPRFDADYLSNPPPEYPFLARRNGEQGAVVLRVHVTPAGLPDQVLIHQSCGSPRLDRAAQETVWRWKFIAARQGDQAVAAWVLVPIRFTLEG